MEMNQKTLSLSLFLTLALNATAQSDDYYRQTDYNEKSTTFRFLGHPDGGKKAVLRLYDEALGGSPVKTVRMKTNGHDGWEAKVKGDWKGKYYTFDVSGNKKQPVESPGVFARAVGVNGQRGAVIDMAETNPDGWNEDRRPELKSPADLVVYEMHFRDFSIAPNSGFKHKGKFLALTEPKAISYLKDLGVNAVHILPSFDYASVDETRLDEPQYNWGYDPLNYNVPEGSYSTNPADPKSRIREFKQMVQALHKAGIRVILDVVYNHTFDLKNSNFQKTWPDAYYRFTKDGKPSDGSGCGNETASERDLMRRFMKESVKYWIEEYHIDGFRFDLMGVHDIETMNQIRDMVNQIDPTIYIYGEGWSAGQCAYPTEKLAVKANTRQLHGIGAFCDDMRDALRGPFSDDHKGGFLAGVKGLEESLKFGIAGCVSHPQIDMAKVNYSREPWANEPTQMISYVSCHDDMCLVDRLRTSMPNLREDDLIRLDLLAQTAVFTSQGVPFMLSGEELLRDKKGVHNSYNSPDSINQLPWENLGRYYQVYSYYKQLIRLRHDHPAFRLASAEKVRRHLEFLAAPDCVVAYRLKDLQGIDPWQEIVVVLNGNATAQRLTIPEGDYKVVVSDGAFTTGMQTMKGGTISVAPRSALILHK